MPRFVSFNINGLRARHHQLEAVRDIISPDIIGLQEIKVADDMFPMRQMEDLGYHAEYFGQKSHYGVALLSKVPPIFVQKGFLDDADDAQRRLIHARYVLRDQEIDVINGYFPQGENRNHETKFPMKRKFYADLTDYIQTLKDENRSLVIMGDMNIAPHDNDIGIGADNAKRWLKNGTCSFLPEERDWYDTLMNLQLHDTYRQLNPDSNEQFSWFDYRSKGFDAEPKRGLRIDHILCTPDLADKLNGAGVSYDIRGMEKPSDHAPIWADFLD